MDKYIFETEPPRSSWFLTEGSVPNPNSNNDEWVRKRDAEKKTEGPERLFSGHLFDIEKPIGLSMIDLPSPARFTLTARLSAKVFVCFDHDELQSNANLLLLMINEGTNCNVDMYMHDDSK